MISMPNVAACDVIDVELVVKKHEKNDNPREKN